MLFARLLGWWVALLALVVGWGLLLTHPLSGSLGRMDDDLARWFADRRTPTLDDLADVGTLLGDTLIGILSAVALAIGFSVWRRSWRPAVFVVTVGLGVYATYLIAVSLVPRQRPPVKILDPGLVPDHSFPSGHVGTSIMLWGCIVVLTWTYAGTARRWVTPLAVLPLVVMISRLYQGAHHLTDVLTSLVFATVWLAIVTRALLYDESTATRRVKVA
ncbi:putative Phosphoesterase, PA-phosphatase related protein [metagenome]|uniref:Putative Phosphoesterase, PA-phosphatase related protein n=1 Tax=metagenome TaxID=256318 RepID=A0A2P2CE82_9ZZZZ